ncbi:MAG: response regulator transcription factor [Hyphomicrobiaceae bacterium]|jgi:DNA-binding response OmpR family regulator
MTAPSIIIVDDDRATIGAISGILREAGYAPTAHASGSNALADPRLETADLVISDWTNAPLGGLGLWQALQARPRPPKVIFLTAWAEEVEELLGPPPGGPAACLSKPFTRRQLLAAVKECLESA